MAGRAGLFMKTSIATVTLAGELPEKLSAIAAAGFDGIEIFEQERPVVRIVGDDLVSRHTRAMTGTCFNSDQDRRIASLGFLQSGSIFEAVPGHYAVIGIGSGDHDGRVDGAFLYVVIRRIFQQGCKLLRIVG